MRELQRLQEIKCLLKTSQISYDEAKKEATPHLVALNQKLDEVAKKFNRKSRAIHFTGFMR